MSRGTRNFYPRRLNNEFSSEFPKGYRGRYTLDEGRRVKRPKRCDKSHKDKDNSYLDNSSFQKLKQKNLLFSKIFDTN